MAPARAESHAGLPPALVVTAGSGRTAQRGRGICAAAAHRESAVVHRDFPGLFHGFVTMMPFARGRFGPGAAVVRLCGGCSRGGWRRRDGFDAIVIGAGFAGLYAVHRCLSEV